MQMGPHRKPKGSSKSVIDILMLTRRVDLGPVTRWVRHPRARNLRPLFSVAMKPGKRLDMNEEDFETSASSLSCSLGNYLSKASPPQRTKRGMATSMPKKSISCALKPLSPNGSSRRSLSFDDSLSNLSGLAGLRAKETGSGYVPSFDDSRRTDSSDGFEDSMPLPRALRTLASGLSARSHSLDDTINSSFRSIGEVIVPPKRVTICDEELSGHQTSITDHAFEDSETLSGLEKAKSMSCLNDAMLQRISRASPRDDGSVEPQLIEEGTSSSDETPPVPLRPSTDEEEDDSSPEALTRRETRSLRVFRVMVLLMLVLVTTLAIGLVVGNTSAAQQAELLNAWDAVAGSLVDCFLANTRTKLFMARSTAELMAHHLQATKQTKTNVTFEDFAGVTSTPLTVANAETITWSPYLQSVRERFAFVAASSSTNTTGIYRIRQDFGPQRDDSPPPYHPIWLQASASNDPSAVMFNQYSVDLRRRSLDYMMDSRLPVWSESFLRHGDLYPNGNGEPGVMLFYPVTVAGEIVGTISVDFSWQYFLQCQPAPNSDLVALFVENTCGQEEIYRVVDQELIAGKDSRIEDLRDEKWSYRSTYQEFQSMIRSTMASDASSGQPSLEACRYRVSVYITSDFVGQFVTSRPAVFAGIIGALFVFTIGSFVAYDYFVVQRQRKVLNAAKRSSAIVSSLFPKSVRGRLYQGGSKGTGGGGSSTGRGGTHSVKGDSATQPSSKSASSGHSITANTRKFLAITPKHRLKSFLESAPKQDDEDADDEPIADLFPCSTVMFLDIAGFTAWSSEREPAQVFKLLETLYGSFDEACRKFGVFKIETIGDSYVAVAGVPDPRDDHAVAMVKFAAECLKRFSKLTKQLEVQLGPSTGELQARVGLHSGPVTGGVLRGEKARFQLFGDTMNCAARMESTGCPGLIQASQATVDLLLDAGKWHWVRARPDHVEIKGKGSMQTFWIKSKKTDSNGTDGESASDGGSMTGSFENSFGLDHSMEMTGAMDNSFDLTTEHLLDAAKIAKSMRLIDWTVEVLHGYLQKIVAGRENTGRPRLTRGNSVAQLVTENETRILGRRGTAVDEIAEVIEMPRFDPRAAKRMSESNEVQLDPMVKDQLREYVMRISSLYRDIPFHSFDHASHVAMSAAKLLKRILQPEGIDRKDKKEHDIAKEIHRSTHGISSDPMMQFAVLFAALIHDVDHTGLPNSQLIKLKTSQGKSSASSKAAPCGKVLTNASSFCLQPSCTRKGRWPNKTPSTWPGPS